MTEVGQAVVQPAGETHTVGAPWYVAELARETSWAQRHGYVDRLIMAGDPACSSPMPPEAFLTVLEAYNTVMEFLHERYPRLRAVRPPNLTQEDLGAETSRAVGRYNHQTATMAFVNPHSICWSRFAELGREQCLWSPKLSGFEGVVMHEYAHHLTTSISPVRPRWLSGLAAMLTENGFIRDESAIQDARAFAEQVGKRVHELGLGSVAVPSAIEFAAEALAWRMSPMYGSSVETPRMPPCLEGWLHECFPFLLDGPAPRRFFVFQPRRPEPPMTAKGVAPVEHRLTVRPCAAAGPGSNEIGATSGVRTDTVRRVQVEAADTSCVN